MDDYEDHSSNFTIQELVLEITESSEIPTFLNFISNFPNPFNRATSIQYDISQKSQVIITIYNMLGNKIFQLDEGLKEAGTHMLRWHGIDGSGNSLSAGIYLYHIRAGQFSKTKKMVLMK